MSRQEVEAATWDAPPRSVDLRVVKSLTLTQVGYSTAGFLPHGSTLTLHIHVVPGTCIF